jgi:pre-rRNA-processing protein RIX1
MASSTSNDQSILIIRAVAYRLTSLPVASLPPVLPHIALQLASCAELLSTPQPPSSEVAATVHQIKTRTSSLLQDRTPEGRFAAVVLIKSLVGLGEWQVLHTSGAWVRGLIAILNRPNDPPALKKLCVIALASIFQSTHRYDNLVREITTPNLPGFVKSCLSMVTTKVSKGIAIVQKQVLETVLRSWVALMPQHPTIFRPFMTPIEQLLRPILGFASGKIKTREPFDPGTIDAAMRVYVLLHASGTKNGEFQDRDSGFTTTLRLAEERTSSVFYKLYGPDDTRVQEFRHRTSLSSEETSDPLQGMCLIYGVLKLLQAYIATASTKPHGLPIGRVIVLLQYITSFSPTDNTSSSKMTKNKRITFLVDLPNLHLSALEISETILARLGKAATAYSTDILECLNGALVANPHDSFTRGMVYKQLATLVKLTGYSLTRKSSRPIHHLIKRCCADLVPESLSQDQPANPPASTGKSQSNHINPNALIGGAQRTRPTASHTTALYEAAWALLPVIVSEIPANSLPKALRIDLERTCILVQHQKALVACTLNPSSDSSSLLPFAAQSTFKTLALEAILRPRMPIIRTRHAGDDDSNDKANGAADDSEEEDAHDWQRPNNRTTTTATSSDLSEPMTSSPSPPPVVASKHPLAADADAGAAESSSRKRARFEISSYMPKTKPAAQQQPTHFEATETPAVVAMSSRKDVSPAQFFAAGKGDKGPAVVVDTQVAQQQEEDGDGESSDDDDGDDDDDGHVDDAYDDDSYDDFVMPDFVLAEEVTHEGFTDDS